MAEQPPVSLAALAGLATSGGTRTFAEASAASAIAGTQAILQLQQQLNQLQQQHQDAKTVAAELEERLTAAEVRTQRSFRWAFSSQPQRPCPNASPAS